VAAQFDLSLRSDKLTWSHHVLLAPLESQEKCYWLERASAERFSVADLRIELRRRQPKPHVPSPGANGTVEADTAKAMVCPQCGHEMVEAAE
jgi:hypothetical protein